MSPNSDLERSSRIDCLAALVSEGARVADVGTDRALLPRRLLSSGRASFCIATERDGARLDRARAACAGAAFAARIDFRAGDGLGALRPDDRIDVVVIAGMGGAAIRRILEAGRPAELGISSLVLEPRTEPAAVRRWLHEHGFAIVDERLGREGRRFFTVIVAAPGRSRPPALGAGTLAEEDLHEAGPCLLRSGNPLLAEFWRAELARNEAILREAGDGRGRGRGVALRRRALASRILAFLSGAPGGRTPPCACPR